MMTTEKKPHVHAELIKAWADGAQIQAETYGVWIDCPNPPRWDEEAVYRIKPEERKPVVRWLWAIKTTGYDKDGEEIVTWVTRRVFKTEKEWEDDTPNENRVKLEWTRTEFPE